MSTFTANSYLDVQILQWLPISDLPKIACLNLSFHSLVHSDLLWDLLLQKEYGSKVLALKSVNLMVSSKEIYSQLVSLPHNSTGYNLALIKKLEIAIAWFRMIGIQPNIEKFMFKRQPNFYRTSPDLLEFFKNVNLGPQVFGSFSPYRLVNDQATGLRTSYRGVIENSSLQEILYCLQPDNPLYGIMTADLIRILFSLHLKISKVEKNGRYRSASPEMRKYLGKLMEDLIDHHLELAIHRSTIDQTEAEQKRVQLKLAIADPSIEVEDIPLSHYANSPLIVFNPNKFSETAYLQLLTFSRINKISLKRVEQISKRSVSYFSHLESAGNLFQLIQLQYRCARLTSKYIQIQK